MSSVEHTVEEYQNKLFVIFAHRLLPIQRPGAVWIAVTIETLNKLHHRISARWFFVIRIRKQNVRRDRYRLLPKLREYLTRHVDLEILRIACDRWDETCHNHNHYGNEGGTERCNALLKARHHRGTRWESGAS